MGEVEDKRMMSDWDAGGKELRELACFLKVRRKLCA